MPAQGDVVVNEVIPAFADECSSPPGAVQALTELATFPSVRDLMIMIKIGRFIKAGANRCHPYIRTRPAYQVLDKIRTR